MKLLNWYIQSFYIEVNKSKDKIIEKIVTKEKKFKLSYNEIEIYKKSSFFNPFASRGTIKINFINQEKRDKTKIDCRIIPFYANHNTIILIVFGFLIIWSIIGIIISHNLNTILTVLLAG